MTKTALVVVTHGSEEMETITPIDVLRRAGVEVTVVGLEDSSQVVLSRKVILVPDCSLAEAVEGGKLYDAVILPGGLGGADNFVNDPELGKVLKAHEKEDRILASVCASSLAFQVNGIGVGKRLTSHPLVKDKFNGDSRYTYLDDRVVKDGNLITSRGPGTALEWSLVVLEELLGSDKAQELGKWMLVGGY